MHRYPFTNSIWRQHDTGTPYPSLSVSESTEVVVIGAGIAGLVCAYELQKRGRQVTLLEALEIGHGTTGHTTAKCSVQHGTIYHKLIGHFDESIARLYYEFNSEALVYLKNQIEEGFDCDHSNEQSFLYSREPNEELTKELDAYRRLKIDGGEATEEVRKALPFSIEQALVIHDQAQFHPVKYLRELAERFVRLGGKIYENSRATEVSQGPRPVVTTSNGRRVQGNQVVIATHYPFNDLRGLYVSKFSIERSYIVACEVESRPLRGMYLEVGQQNRSFRSYSENGKSYLLVGGEGHTAGQVTDTRLRYDRLENDAQAHFGTHRASHRWSSQDLITLDGLPYVGQMFKREPDLFVATGFSKWGMTNGIAAGTLLADQLTGHANRFVELVSPLRQTVKPNDISAFLKTNLDTAAQFTKGTVNRLLERNDVQDLQLDEGGVVQVDGKTKGVYRDLDNKCHVVNLTCTHLGCTVKWNNAERSWDCPCHGSRFDAKGTVLEGPATKPLSYSKREDL
ncbi:FAD-dependent oxidoreductase [Exiguobacterium sp. PFWT01]|uniref:FAD-dependent oxidoreductase n=1 Tax=Exiguobacterium sp. PFWT01 TaxID=2829816 RepID=UPI001BA9D038|nr:FAD-dependent oxidoreductase [Exiguobacterium sp. PFWT01]QUP88486.1 FAD-dependent oxidoreductase [Exiguobacterium sp. PFWT01]